MPVKKRNFGLANKFIKFTLTIYFVVFFVAYDTYLWFADRAINLNDEPSLKKMLTCIWSFAYVSPIILCLYKFWVYANVEEGEYYEDCLYAEQIEQKKTGGYTFEGGSYQPANQVHASW